MGDSHVDSGNLDRWRFAMPPDTVQIGSLLISKSILDIVFPLLGTLIGGFITYLATSVIENRKWKRERVGKLQEQQREAVARALDWMVPLSSALIQVESLTSALQSNSIDEEQFRNKYPDVISTLAKMDPPSHMIVMLPESAYARGHEILMGFERLKALNLMSHSSNECFDMVSTLRAMINGLQDYLRQEYLKTFA
jgi:hypothetical protein